MAEQGAKHAANPSYKRISRMKLRDTTKFKHDAQ
jgi:hypothetical protein